MMTDEDEDEDENEDDDGDDDDDSDGDGDGDGCRGRRFPTEKGAQEAKVIWYNLAEASF